MAGLNNIKKEISVMSALALSMWRRTHQAFMEHDLELLAKVLD